MGFGIATIGTQLPVATSAGKYRNIAHTIKLPCQLWLITKVSAWSWNRKIPKIDNIIIYFWRPLILNCTLTESFNRCVSYWGTLVSSLMNFCWTKQKQFVNIWYYFFIFCYQRLGKGSWTLILIDSVVCFEIRSFEIKRLIMLHLNAFKKS